MEMRFRVADKTSVPLDYSAIDASFCCCDGFSPIPQNGAGIHSSIDEIGLCGDYSCAETIGTNLAGESSTNHIRQILVGWGNRPYDCVRIRWRETVRRWVEQRRRDKGQVNLKLNSFKNSSNARSKTISISQKLLPRFLNQNLCSPHRGKQ
jgi:hypothetical protein